ncbi:MAG TPA: thioredoxin domain-containing protein, partial [Caldisericia bacterium]|nr:thioredoxin domain-containing protein [Caldisericia bacterium]
MKKIILSFLLIILILLPPLNLVNSEESYTIKRIPKDLYPDVINKSQNVLLETFTATWCGWCHYAYEVFDELKKNFGDRILNIRYHNQDTISMQEVPERAVYYKVSGYPTVLINGSKKIVGVDENSYPEFEK